MAPMRDATRGTGATTWRTGIVLVAILALAGCGARRSRIAHLTAPDPYGCYIEVFDDQHFRGERDFINGPVKHARLTERVLAASWRHRIRSLKVGPAATMTAWAAEGFEGVSLRLGPDRHHPRLTETFSGKIASLQIDCDRRHIVAADDRVR